MKFLVAGLGSIGRRHLRNLVALGQTDILLYRTNRSTLPDDELVPYRAFYDLSEALSQKPDAVIVANPTSLHLEVAIPAAESGCNLLLEKPISDDLTRIQDLKQAILRGGGQVLVGFQFRFHPGLRKIKELLESKQIGNLVSIHAHWGEFLPGWHPWEDYRHGYAARHDLGGGVIRTLSHPIDYLFWLIGDISAVWASTGRLGGLDIPVEDTAVIGLEFNNGVIGSLQVNYVQNPPVHRLEIIGTHGTIRWDNSDGSVHCYRCGENATWEIYPVPSGFERNHLFIAEMEHFLDIIQVRRFPVCSLEDGIKVQTIVDAVYRSAAERKSISV